MDMGRTVGDTRDILSVSYTESAAPIAPEHEALLVRLAARVVSTHPVPRPVQIVLTDDSFIRILNTRYRGKGTATDVLSFDLSSADQVISPPAGGEVYVSLDRARVQAHEQRVSFLQEVARLMTHGLLHLAGYDHDSPAALRAMEEETDRLLCNAGLSEVGASL